MRSEQYNINESKEKEKGEAEKTRNIQDVFELLLQCRIGGTYAKSSEDGFSGDASSISVLVQFDEKPIIVKVGWGEFSKETFDKDIDNKLYDEIDLSNFKNLPFNVYCVSQKDSYFADDKLKKEAEEDPKKYLSENSIFVANNGSVEMTRSDEKKSLNIDSIEPENFDNLIREARNLVIKQRTDPEKFTEFLNEMPDNLDELGKWVIEMDSYPNGERNKDMISILKGMGIETMGFLASDKKSMESLLELKKNFDFKNKTFT